MSPIKRTKGLYYNTVDRLMTISTYPVDSVLKAYNEQIRLNRHASSRGALRDTEHYVDVVSLSGDSDKKDAYQKISYCLLEILLKGRV